MCWVEMVQIVERLGKGYRYGRTETRKEADWKKAYVYIDPNYKPSPAKTEEVVEELKKH